MNESTEKDQNEDTPRESQGVFEQVKGALILLPVLGILWLIFTFLPKFGDWMGATADRVVGTPGEHATTGEEADAVSSEGNPPLASTPSSQVEAFRQQLVEQLGGPEFAEVRHLALSDNQSRMVAAVKRVSSKDSQSNRVESETRPSLIEIFFERDEFGRFVSTDDSPLEEKIILWNE